MQALYARRVARRHRTKFPFALGSKHILNLPVSPGNNLPLLFKEDRAIDPFKPCKACASCLQAAHLSLISSSIRYKDQRASQRSLCDFHWALACVKLTSFCSLCTLSQPFSCKSRSDQRLFLYLPLTVSHSPLLPFAHRFFCTLWFPCYRSSLAISPILVSSRSISWHVVEKRITSTQNPSNSSHK